jgi:hypothetical protein
MIPWAAGHSQLALLLDDMSCEQVAAAPKCLPAAVDTATCLPYPTLPAHQQLFPGHHRRQHSPTVIVCLVLRGYDQQGVQ